MSKANAATVRRDATPPNLSRERSRELAAKRLAELTDEEDAELTAAALADPDAQPVDHSKLRRGRPPAAATKQLVSLRLDRDVLDAFRDGGDGWQTRMNEILRKAVGL